MSVPEAAMHKDYLASGREHQIRFAGQSGAVQAGDSFKVSPTANGAKEIGTVLSDPSKIAFAAPLQGEAGKTNQGTGTFTLSGGASNGCDSVVTLNLTINTINTSITLANDTLMATTTGANYQWIDCTNNTAILGATSQQFIPTANGDYAVIISQNACVDTSNCITVVVVGLEGMPQSSTLIYPNPFKDVLQVNLGTNTEAKLRIMNANGQLVRAVQNLTTTSTSIDLGDLSAGVYWLTIQSTKGLETYKIIKQ